MRAQDYEVYTDPERSPSSGLMGIRRLESGGWYIGILPEGGRTWTAQEASAFLAHRREDANELDGQDG